MENMLALRNTQEHGGTCSGFCKQFVHAYEQACRLGIGSTKKKKKKNVKNYEVSEGART